MLLVDSKSILGNNLAIFRKFLKIAIFRCRQMRIWVWFVMATSNFANMIYFLWNSHICCIKCQRKISRHFISYPFAISNLCYCLVRIKSYFDIACFFSRSAEFKHSLYNKILITHHKQGFMTRNIDSVSFGGRVRRIIAFFHNFWKKIKCKFRKNDF